MLLRIVIKARSGLQNSRTQLEIDLEKLCYYFYCEIYSLITMGWSQKRAEANPNHE